MTSTGWHLDKKVPIGLMVGVAMQLILLVVFFVKMDNRIGNIEEWKKETSADRFTSNDAVFLNYKIAQNQANIVKMDIKLDTLITDMASVKAALNIPPNSNIARATIGINL